MQIIKELSMNKNIPSYLVERNNTILYLIFVMFFSLAFVNIFRPFKGAWYNTHDVAKYQLFFASVIIVLGGIFIMSLSRFLMSVVHHKHPLTYIQYGAWLILEMTVIAMVYSLISHYALTDSRPFALIFGRAIVNVPLILLIPGTIGYLYFGIKERDIVISSLSNPNLDTASNVDYQQGRSLKKDFTNDIINFIDEKGDLKLSVKTYYIYFLEASDNYVYIYYMNKDEITRFLLRSSMKKQENHLIKYGFVRCHRSYIVNFAKVVLMRKDKDGPYLDLGQKSIKEIPVSKTYLEQVTNHFSYES